MPDIFFNFVVYKIFVYIICLLFSSEDVSEDGSEVGLDSDESEGKDWSDLEREAAEDDDDDDDDRGMYKIFCLHYLFTNFQFLIIDISGRGPPRPGHRPGHSSHHKSSKHRYFIFLILP